MKNIKYLFLILTLAIFTVSCEDDGGTSTLDLIEGAVPNMAKADGSELIIDLNKLTAGSPILLAFTAEVAQGTPVTTDIIGSYAKSSGEVYAGTLFSDVGNEKQDFTLTPAQIVSVFSELSSTADIELGDVLSITTRHTMENGIVLSIINDDGTGGTGSNIRSTVLFNTVISYPVSCPTALQGDYIATVTASNTDLISPLPVTITQPSAGTYILSDGVLGVFGPDFPIGLTFTDVCNTISVQSPSVQYPGQVDYIDRGATLNPETGVITMQLGYAATSCCGLPGIEWTIELTPVN